MRKLSEMWAFALKKMGQPCPRPEKKTLKNIVFKGRPSLGPALDNTNMAFMRTPLLNCQFLLRKVDYYLSTSPVLVDYDVFGNSGTGQTQQVTHKAISTVSFNS
jgi:hypothetical protein